MSLPAVAFLVLLGAVIPWTAWESGVARDQRGTAYPRPLIYRSAGTVQVVLLGLALALAMSEGIRLFGPYAPTASHLMIGAGALGLRLLLLLPPEWVRITSDRGRARAAEITPVTRGEWLGYGALVGIAATAEEIIYRGVAFSLLAGVLPGWWLPALGAALMFGLSHLYQGVRSAAIVVLFGLVAQAVVLWTGTLYVEMGVHLIYDLAAGVVAARRAPLESAAA